ncbi:unnamed protein product [Enterobius vermicularis]|uniref:Uncharacterized protein n=1 Tax=Enterobius vermicularis TaxID=51028 RepID=A0A0N4VHB5_ENTVE|nr:unnamed protein product [Enterobius vermicularis]
MSETYDSATNQQGNEEAAEIQPDSVPTKERHRYRRQAKWLRFRAHQFHLHSTERSVIGENEPNEGLQQ